MWDTLYLLLLSCVVITFQKRGKYEEVCNDRNRNVCVLYRLSHSIFCPLFSSLTLSLILSMSISSSLPLSLSHTHSLPLSLSTRHLPHTHFDWVCDSRENIAGRFSPSFRDQLFSPPRGKLGTIWLQYCIHGKRCFTLTFFDVFFLILKFVEFL